MYGVCLVFVWGYVWCLCMICEQCVSGVCVVCYLCPRCMVHMWYIFVWYMCSIFVAYVWCVWCTVLCVSMLCMFFYGISAVTFWYKWRVFYVICAYVIYTCDLFCICGVYIM